MSPEQEREKKPEVWTEEQLGKAIVNSLEEERGLRESELPERIEMLVHARILQECWKKTSEDYPTGEPAFSLLRYAERDGLLMPYTNLLLGERQLLSEAAITRENYPQTAVRIVGLLHSREASSSQFASELVRYGLQVFSADSGRLLAQIHNTSSDIIALQIDLLLRGAATSTFYPEKLREFWQEEQQKMIRYIEDIASPTGPDISDEEGAKLVMQASRRAFLEFVLENHLAYYSGGIDGKLSRVDVRRELGLEN